ncbi:Nif11-like leader peptide family RiPP precursor [Succiniclasticum ruminis]|uniref:Nif11-like leader peptide domain-containing protein n=1 Tax=Succiniclasticum ruminis DSM 9236 TaxID=1123323 RepID=A0A1I2DGA2_9FIRM|nr:Nif11-like leader peptide family RiPP precursor [Succiniclasticum ruminis]SFE79233.1 nif11-like leader peptide domain-containing protein [Succiniclasticum ruminis DSM 9236]
MPVNKDELTKDMIEKAMECKDADELIALAKAEGFAITKDEAEAYMSEMADVELNEETLKKVAGGICWDNVQNPHECGIDCIYSNNNQG